jgi:ketosteroid isomerase-like protein
MNRAEQQHNLKVAELAYTAFNAGTLAPLLKICDEEVEVEVTTSDQGMTAGTHRGHEGFREWFESFDEYKAQPTEVLPIGAQLVVLVKQGAKEKDGDPVESEGAHMLAFEGGNISALRLYATRDEAVAAAKKRESDSADG